MEINKEGKIFIGVFVVLALGVAVAFNSLGEKKEVKGAETGEVQLKPITTTTDNNMQITDEVVGKGAEAVAGKSVVVHYTGTLTNGKKFDSSKDRGTPFTFTLGAGQVIKGWDLGVAGMKVGGKRKLVIPSELAYGRQEVGNGLIPANSTLMFEVELLEVK